MTGPAVGLDTDMRALVDLVADQELVIVDRTVDADLRAAFARTLAAWPVKTGASRAGLTFVRSGRVLSWGVSGKAGHTGAIKVDGQLVAETLLRAPLVAALDTAIDKLNRGGP